MTILVWGIDLVLGKVFNKDMQSDPVEVVAAIFHRIRDGEVEVLLFRRASHVSGAGFWEFPGGKVEPGESREQALTREIQEELGVQVHVGQEMGQNIHQFPQKKVKLIAFLVELIPGVFNLKDHDGFRWIKEGDLNQFKVSLADVPLMPHVFRHLKSKN